MFRTAQYRSGSRSIIPLLPDRSTKMHSRLYLYLSVFICGSIGLFGTAPAPAQYWFKTGTGLGVSKARVGVADFAAKDTPSQPLATLFSDVLRTVLEYCGILELVSKSYKPLQPPATPAEVDYKAWSGSPTSAQLLAFGGFSVNGNNVEIQAW